MTIDGVWEWLAVAAVLLYTFGLGMWFQDWNNRRFDKWTRKMWSEVEDAERQVNDLILDLNQSVVNEMEKPHVN